MRRRGIFERNQRFIDRYNMKKALHTASHVRPARRVCCLLFADRSVCVSAVKMNHYGDMEHDEFRSVMLPKKGRTAQNNGAAAYHRCALSHPLSGYVLACYPLHIICVVISSHCICLTCSLFVFMCSASGDVPASIDWRQLGAVHQPKDQGACGSCVRYITYIHTYIHTQHMRRLFSLSLCVSYHCTVDLWHDGHAAGHVLCEARRAAVAVRAADRGLRLGTLLLSPLIANKQLIFVSWG